MYGSIERSLSVWPISKGLHELHVRKNSLQLRKSNLQVRKSSLHVRKSSLQVRKCSLHVRKSSLHVRKNRNFYTICSIPDIYTIFREKKK